MTDVGIDTSVLIGLLDAQDLWHDPSVALKEAIEKYQANLVVFDCVLAEAISTMARRIHEQRRDADLDRLLALITRDYPRDVVMWILPDVPVLYEEVVELVRSSRGELNFNDALIAVSCRHRDIPIIASFDRDYDRVPWLRRVSLPAHFG